MIDSFSNKQDDNKCINFKTKNLVESLKRKNYIESKIVEDVICSLDRKKFMKNKSNEYESYLDKDIYIGYGATMSSIKIHSFILEKLQNKISRYDRHYRMNLMILGSGSGYLYNMIK